MDKYPPRSQRNKYKEKINSKDSVNNKLRGNMEMNSGSEKKQIVDPLNLPSRKEVHQSKLKINTNKATITNKSQIEHRKRRTKSNKQRFPLIKVLLILFLLLVIAVVTYPFWIEKI